MAAYVGFARRHPQLYRLMFSPLGYSLHSDRCRINAQRAMSVLIESVAESQSSGWRTGTDPVHLVLSFWGLGHGWAGLLIDNLLPDDTGFDPESWIESAMVLL